MTAGLGLPGYRRKEYNYEQGLTHNSYESATRILRVQNSSTTDTLELKAGTAMAYNAALTFDNTSGAITNNTDVIIVAANSNSTTAIQKDVIGFLAYDISVPVQVMTTPGEVDVSVYVKGHFFEDRLTFVGESAGADDADSGTSGSRLLATYRSGCESRGLYFVRSGAIPTSSIHAGNP